jgi:hypothetical protein
MRILYRVYKLETAYDVETLLMKRLSGLNVINVHSNPHASAVTYFGETSNCRKH